MNVDVAVVFAVDFSSSIAPKIADLQREGAESFVESWKDLLNCIGSKSATLKAAG